MEVVYIVIGAAIVVAILVALAYACAFTIAHQTAGVVERFNRFHRIARSGLGFKIPIIDRIVSRITLRVVEIPVAVSTFAQDIDDQDIDDRMVSVRIGMVVQVVVSDTTDGGIQDAYYLLNRPKDQIESWVCDTVRAHVPSMSLRDVIEKKDDIALAVEQQLLSIIGAYGYKIVRALVTDVSPDDGVVRAMNDVSTAARERAAAFERAEAARIVKEKQAEADARDKELQGQGIAKQRSKLVEGLQESVTTFRAVDPTAKVSDIMQWVLMTQYFDTLKDLGDRGVNTIFLPHSPSGLTDIANQIRTAMLTADAAPKY